MAHSGSHPGCIKIVSLKNRVSGVIGRKPQRAVSPEENSKALDALCPRDVRRLHRFAKAGTLKRYDVLLKGGENNQTLFLITKGSCLIRHDKSFFAEIEQGHFVGEISFLTGRPASVDVVARSEIEYLCWERDRLEKLLKRNPKLRSQFYSLLGSHMANRLWHATEKLVAA